MYTNIHLLWIHVGRHFTKYMWIRYCKNSRLVSLGSLGNFVKYPLNKLIMKSIQVWGFQSLDDPYKISSKTWKIFFQNLRMQMKKINSWLFSEEGFIFPLFEQRVDLLKILFIKGSIKGVQSIYSHFFLSWIQRRTIRGRQCWAPHSEVHEDKILCQWLCNKIKKKKT